MFVFKKSIYNSLQIDIKVERRVMIMKKAYEQPTVKVEKKGSTVSNAYCGCAC